MSATFFNTYNDPARAAAYATLEFPGTYYLAFRDLPAIIAEHVRGPRALDFGCGAGRSTRFLQSLGFQVTGVDISQRMLAAARERDPRGDYLLVPDGGFGALPKSAFDLVLCAFPFDNIPTMEKKVRLLRGLRSLLRPAGRVVNLVSAPDIYCHEWLSFSTKDFPDNRSAACGDTVRIVMLDVEDRRPVEDILWPHEDYLDTYRRSALRVVHTHRPLGTRDESHAWVSETEVSPWTIYVLGRADGEAAAGG
jgi:SAM-dependent methyltransferase